MYGLERTYLTLIFLVYGHYPITTKSLNVKYVGGGYVDFKYNIIELTNTKLKVQRLEQTGVGSSQIMELLMQYEFEPK